MDKTCESTVEQKHFRAPMWMVRLPYWLGETYFKLFEMGWEVLVMVYALVAQMLYYFPRLVSMFQ